MVSQIVCQSSKEVWQGQVFELCSAVRQSSWGEGDGADPDIAWCAVYMANGKGWGNGRGHVYWTEEQNWTGMLTGDPQK